MAKILGWGENFGLGEHFWVGQNFDVWAKILGLGEFWVQVKILGWVENFGLGEILGSVDWVKILD